MNKIIAEIISVTLLLILVVSGSVYAQESNNESSLVFITIVNHVTAEDNSLFTKLESDVPAYIVDGTTMVPLRALTEGFGYNVAYQEKDKKIIIKDADGKNELIFTISSTTVLQNGHADTMLQAPVIRNSRTFIPLRYVSEFFGKYVTWEKGIDKKMMYIWVSSVQLLTEEDVAAEDDEVNYYLSTSSMPGFPYYALRSNGQTYRGIKIGDKFEKVVDLYGEPHEKVYLKDGSLSRAIYHTESLPGTDSGSIINFLFIDGLVNFVGIDGR